MAQGETEELEWEWMCALHPRRENTWHVTGRPTVKSGARVCVHVCVLKTNAKDINVVTKARFRVKIMGEGEQCVGADGNGGEREVRH